MDSPQRRKTVRHYDEPGGIHELTFSCYQRWPLLNNNVCRRYFCEALQQALIQKHYRLYAFVVMPEHVHLIVQGDKQSSTISEFLGAVKRPCSYRIKCWLTEHQHPWLAKLTIQQRPGITTFRFWQEGPGYDRNLTDAKTLLAAIDYIHLNPVRRGLCQAAKDWQWSSAVWHEQQRQGPVAIDAIPKDWF